jgi:hypothetical protein
MTNSRPKQRCPSRSTYSPSRTTATRRKHRRAVGHAAVHGWCLDKEDLCVTKLCAFREKDQNFVAALLDAGLVDAEIIGVRLATVPDEHLLTAERALAWLAARR